VAAKASVAQVSTELLARGPSGVPTQPTDLSQAQEQLRHFSGWVYASIRPIAQRIAGQPIHVGRTRSPRRTASKSASNVEALDSHPILDLLADPNDLMVAWSLIFSTVASLQLTGRQLWWLPKKEAIYPIPTSWIVGFEGATKFQSFKVRPPSTAEAVSLPADETVYFSYPDPSNPHGAKSPLQAQAKAVNTDESLMVSQQEAFEHGIMPKHLVMVGKDANGRRPTLSGEQQRQIIGAIRKRYQGAVKSHEPIILDGLIEDVKRLSAIPQEMDFLRSATLTKSRIMQGFGTNPIIAGELENANRASATVADRHFCEYVLNPTIELMSQVLTEYMGPMFGGGIKIWLEPCVANDAEMSIKWAEMLAKHGVIKADELRRLSPFDLPEDSAFDGQLVGGRNMATFGPIESGIAAMIREQVGELGADRLLADLTPNRNGKARVTE